MLANAFPKTAATMLAVLLSVVALAQDQSTGFPPFASIERGGFDAVNRQNLNIHFEIPIASFPGRGIPFNYALVYDSLVWAKSSGAWKPVTDANGSPTWGWKMASPFGTTKKTYFTERCDTPPPAPTATHYMNYKYVDAGGTVHNFDLNFYSTATVCGFNTGPRTGYATDGSGIYLDATAPLAPKVTLPQGFNATLVKDTNGNFIGFGGSTYTDTRNQPVLINPSNGVYQVLDQTGQYQTTTVNFTSYLIKTNFTCSGVVEYTGSASLPTSIDLPNGLHYYFEYETNSAYPSYKTGRLKKVTLPTGGYYEYIYPTSPNNGTSCADGTPVTLTRNIYDSTNTAQWGFSRSGNTTTVTKPQLPYDSAANQSVYTFDSGSLLETSATHYQGSSTVLSTLNTSYSTDVTRTLILPGNLQAKTVTTYGPGYQIAQLVEHDFGSGAPGAAIRTTTNTFVTDTNYTSRNITTLISSTVIREGGPTGPIKFRRNITYDGATPTCVTGAAQHDDSNFGCSFNYRGNPTGVTTFADAANQNGGVDQNFYYDTLGNLRTTSVGGVQQQQLNFSSAHAYALPNSVVQGPSTGQQLTTSFTYNTYTGNRTSVTDPNSQVTSFAYDNYGRLTSASSPGGGHQAWTYDSLYNIATLDTKIDTSGNYRHDQFYWDGLGRTNLMVSIDAAWTTRFAVAAQYDPLGRQYKASNPYTGSPAYWTETRYDALGRTIMVIPPDGSPSSNNISYYYSGAAVTVVDQAGKQRRQDVDGVGRLAQVVEPDPGNGNSLSLATSYAYNVLDQVTHIFQGIQDRAYCRDDLGRVTCSVIPETGTTTFAYNSFDQVTQRTDARGVITSYAYDTLNRLTTKSYNVGSTGVPATSSVTYTYDTSPVYGATIENPIGRLVLVATNSGALRTIYSYDAMGQVKNSWQCVTPDVGCQPTTVNYNLARDVSSIVSFGRTISYNHDNFGALSSIVVDGTTYANSFSYNPAQQLTSYTQGNGVVVTPGYSADRLQLSSLTYNKSGTDLFKLTYGYTQNGGNNGQITSITDNLLSARTASYTYDTLNRLTGATATGGSGIPAMSKSFSYDRYGNRNGIASIDAATNRYNSYGYDANGNMTSEPSPLSTAYTYDAENRLVSFTNSAGTSTYTYDGNDLRVKKVSGGNSTVYFYNGTDIAGEFVNGSYSTDYVYGPQGKLAKFTPSGVSYYGVDHLSKRFTTDVSGTLLSTQGHLPFGETWYGATNDKEQFTSYERDAESGNDYAIFRSYTARIGRFTSPDPYDGSIDLSNPQSMNRYVYVMNDPVNLIDPLGLNHECKEGAYEPQEKCGSHELRPGGCYDIYVDGTYVSNTCAFFRRFILDWNDIRKRVAKAARAVKKAVCSFAPQGRTAGLSGGFAYQTVSAEHVVNYNTGEASLFFSHGLEAGLTCLACVGGTGGGIYNLGSSNKNYSGGFTSASAGYGPVTISGAMSSGGVSGPPAINPSGANSVTATVGASVSPFPVVAVGAQNFSKPVALGNIYQQPLNATGLDYVGVAANYYCK